MTSDVKRPYRSSLRDRQTALTHTGILDAAHERFLADGYAATTVRAVAETAGVSERTVYNAFGDKASLFYEVGRRIVTGELGSDGTHRRDLASELRAEPDPVRRIRVLAAWTRMVWEQGMLEFESMFLDAAASDPNAARIVKDAWRQKYEDIRSSFPLLFPAAARRGETDSREAIDVLFALDSAAFVRILIHDRGWTYDQYEDWLAATLQRLFLDIG